ncbi:MAG TPA: hypothetical protein VHE13_10855 [Opitutus sp.]|nr:hypothetical protein [Opitutus sp.]
MRRSATVLLPLALLAVFALRPAARAQAAAPADADRTAAASADDTALPARDRPLSNHLSAALTSSLPKYNPPPKPRPEDEDVDLRDVDKPRNGIVRLPKYVVHQRRPPVFRERDIYTDKGLSEVARRRYLTPLARILNSFYIPFLTASPDDLAMAQYREDERLANMADLDDTADTISRGDPKAGAYIKRVSDETYMRTTDFTWRPGQNR